MPEREKYLFSIIFILLAIAIVLTIVKMLKIK